VHLAGASGVVEVGALLLLRQTVALALLLGSDALAVAAVRASEGCAERDREQMQDLHI